MKRHKIKKAVKIALPILLVLFITLVAITGIKTARGEDSRYEAETTTHEKVELPEFTTEDPYHAKDYGNADDFYEDNQGNFYDREDAEQYWENNQ